MSSVSREWEQTATLLTRRQVLGTGSAALLGLLLPGEPAAAAPRPVNGPRRGTGAGFGRARAAILLFLRGGASHLDLWDPKPEAPAGVRGDFPAIPTTVPGIRLAETLPLLARQMRHCALIRSVNFAPAGLHHHAASVCQVLTGRPPSQVSPCGATDLPPFEHLWPGDGLARGQSNRCAREAPESRARSGAAAVRPPPLRGEPACRAAAGRKGRPLRRGRLARGGRSGGGGGLMGHS